MKIDILRKIIKKMFNKSFSKKFKVKKNNIFLFSLLLTQIAVPTFELFKPSSAIADTQLGTNASATGSPSIAIGEEASAQSPFSISIGKDTSAEEVDAIAIGRDSISNGEFSIAIGAESLIGAIADYAIVIGGESNAQGTYSTALGFNNDADANYSTAIGALSNAGYAYSTAIGAGATTDKINQIVLGTSTETVTVKGELVVGVDGDYTLITREGLTVDGKNVIKKENDGSIHIGENSLITIEEDGKQKLYGQDESGNAIPIDITNGSKLLINGRDVEQSINNVGALSAALTGLPTLPTDTTLACGLGTGTHGGDFAFSGGCASKVNEKLSFNYAASMTMPGQDYAGDFTDQFSARAGFVWKLGKSNEPTKISLSESKELKKEVQDLKAKNDAIISQNAKLLARLEKLENIAFTLQKNERLKLSKGL